jgi:energy-coupling factor transporter ATP-binding protein EcfA2
MADPSRYFIAVTGAQGVGKSTFCQKLVKCLDQASRVEVQLLDGLGESVKAMGVPLGSASTPETIFAVWTTHLEREYSAAEGLTVLDRCVVDALAYTRVLAVSTPLQLRMLEKTAVLASRSLGLVVHLRLSSFFEDRGGAHETADHRRNVASEIELILEELQIPRIDLDADDDQAIDIAVRAILKCLDGG